MKYKFVINGQETIVEGPATSTLSDLKLRALQQTGNLGRPASDFQAFHKDMKLDPECTMENQLQVDARGMFVPHKHVFDESSIIFVSLKFAFFGSEKKEESKAYLAGYNCGFIRPDERNSHYGFFKTEESRNDWTRGRDDGERDKKLKEQADEKK